MHNPDVRNKCIFIVCVVLLFIDKIMIRNRRDSALDVHYHQVELSHNDCQLHPHPNFSYSLSSAMTAAATNTTAEKEKNIVTVTRKQRDNSVKYAAK